MGMQFQSDHQEEEELTPYATRSELDDPKPDRKAVYFYVAAGLGLLILVLAFVMLGNGSDRQETANRLNRIEKRLDDLEFRLGNLVQSAVAGSDLGLLQKTDEDLSQRFDALEKKLAGRLNQISAALAQLEKQRPAAAKKPPAAATPTPPQTKTRLHTVQKGETLYQI
nr:hypothetical protein [Desulfobacterales bacterium]